MNKKFAWLLPVLCLLLVLPVVALAENQSSYDISEGNVTIDGSCGASCAGHTITGTSTANTISVTGGTHKVTLNGVNIAFPSDCSGSPFSISSGAHVNLKLAETNILKAKGEKAGLNVPSGATLVITADSTGSLEAAGDDSVTDAGAGIGGNHNESNGSIFINGGTVTATGGRYAAGIGGGRYADGKNITINGGAVTAEGAEHGAGIGGGESGNGSYITINGGTVTAEGGNNAAGIGGGYGADTAKPGKGNGCYITISGGTVTATGGFGAAGIGGGLATGGNGSVVSPDRGIGSKITITGGKIKATTGNYDGSYFAAGIGGGYGGSSSDITVSGGITEAEGVQAFGVAPDTTAFANVKVWYGSSSSACSGEGQSPSVLAYNHPYVRIAEGEDTFYTVNITVSPAEGGTVSGGGRYKENDNVTVRASANTGYKFVGWYVEDEKASENASESFPAKMNLDLIAKFEKQQYTVSFNANGGSGSMAAQVFAAGEEKALAANAFTRDGYSFAGWKDENGKTYTDGQVVSFTSNATLTAQWKVNTPPSADPTATVVPTARPTPTPTPAPTKAPGVCLAIYYPNGGQGTMKPQTLSGREAVLNLNTYTREGYEFIGWNTSADGSGDFYEDGARVPTRNSIILYAQWKKIDAPVVTEAPTAVPTAVPTVEPTAVPTAEPTAAPTAEPTATPIVTVAPTATPIVTAEPTVTPIVTVEPTATPVVTVPPVVHELKIVKQPEDQYVVEGQRADFNVEAVGEGLNYQWYINRNDGKGWVNLSNAIGDSYTTSVVDLDCNGFLYRCIVNDTHGNTAVSDSAELHVSAAPVIPETGDCANPVLWISMALLGLAGLILLRRKQYN